MSKAGFVYVLSNESMPGIVKIGRSIHGGRARAKQLYSGASGVPTPFRHEFELAFDSCTDAEIMVHERLCDNRISDAREFFRISVDDAIAAVLAVRAEFLGYCLVSETEFIDPVDFHCMAQKIEPDSQYECFLDLITCIPLFLEEQAVRDALTLWRRRNVERLKKKWPDKVAAYLERHPTINIDD